LASPEGDGKGLAERANVRSQSHGLEINFPESVDTTMCLRLEASFPSSIYKLNKKPARAGYK
jgi:hypothetical protein